MKKRSNMEIKLRGNRAERIMQEVFEKERKQTKNPDTENRKEVKKKMADLFKNGKSKEEAVDTIMESESIKNFDYLEKNGLDLRTCLMGWLDAELRVKDIEEKGYDR